MARLSALRRRDSDIPSKASSALCIEHGATSQRYPKRAYNISSPFPFVYRCLASERLILVAFFLVGDIINRELGHIPLISFDSSWLGPWSGYSALHLQQGGSNTGGYLFLFFHKRNAAMHLLSAQTETVLFLFFPLTSFLTLEGQKAA